MHPQPPLQPQEGVSPRHSQALQMHAIAQQSPMAVASAILEQRSSPENNDGILVGTVIPLQQPDEVAGGVQGGRSWAKACFCFSGLLFAFAALAVVIYLALTPSSHYDIHHFLHRFSHFMRHFHVLVIVFSVAMLCGAAGLVRKFMKARQPSLGMGVDDSLQRARCVKAIINSHAKA